MFFFSPALGRPWAEIFLYKTGVLGFAEGRREGKICQSHPENFLHQPVNICHLSKKEDPATI